MTLYTTTLPDAELFNDNSDDFWVFAYGSLMWKPDFEFTDRQPAVLSNYCRALCIYSWVHRGTQETPGLVFGLHHGDAVGDINCQGVAFKIPPHAQASAVEMLRARELVTNVYQEAQGPIELTGSTSRQVNALFYTAVEDHNQYAGTLTHSELVRFVRQGIGGSGKNTDYVLSTFDQLEAEGIDDPVLAKLCADLRG